MMLFPLLCLSIWCDASWIMICRLYDDFVSDVMFMHIVGSIVTRENFYKRHGLFQGIVLEVSRTEWETFQNTLSRTTYSQLRTLSFLCVDGITLLIPSPDSRGMTNLILKCSYWMSQNEQIRYVSSWVWVWFWRFVAYFDKCCKYSVGFKIAKLWTMGFLWIAGFLQMMK